MKAVTLQRRQRGYFTLISAGAAVTVFGILMAIQASQYASKGRSDAAQTAGVLAGQFKNALRAAVASEGTSLATGTRTGTAWLKRAGACSGATGGSAYLPCEFPDHLPLGLSYRTTVSVSGGTVRARVALGSPESAGEAYAYLAGAITTAINGASNDHVTPVTQTYHSADHDDAGNITITVSNGPENNEYLRRDGIVRATGNFNWGGFDLSNVGELSADQVSASSVTTSGNVTAGGDVRASGAVRGTTLYGSRFVDLDIYDGVQYEVNPSSSSRLRGNLSTGGNLSANRFNLTGTETEGGTCTRRSLGFDSNGEPMYCNASNRWQRIGGGDTRFVGRNTTLINTTSAGTHGFERRWTFTSADMGLRSGAYAAQIQILCGTDRHDNIQYHITSSATGSTFRLLVSKHVGNADLGRFMNTIVIPVEGNGGTITITKPAAAQACAPNNHGLQVYLAGYFENV